MLMSTNSKFEINTSDTIKCISSSGDGRKIAFGNNGGDIFLVDDEGKTITETEPAIWTSAEPVFHKDGTYFSVSIRLLRF